MLPLEDGRPESPDPVSEAEGSDLTCALTKRLPTTELKIRNIIDKLKCEQYFI